MWVDLFRSNAVGNLIEITKVVKDNSTIFAITLKTCVKNQHNIILDHFLWCHYHRPYIMEIKIQSTRFIKPSNPTPENLRHFKLSALDQLAPDAYTNMIFYYETSGDQVDRCGQLVKSLSEVLNLYYPLAGRITQDRLQVDCSDQGVKYLETRVSIRLNDFLSQGPNTDHVGLLISKPDLVSNPLITVQVNIFECGSLVIGVTASHKVTDAYGLVRFINEWANTNRTWHSDGAYGPSFDNLASIFPPMELIPSQIEQGPIKFDPEPVILTKRYVFNRTAISNLRAKAGPEVSKHSRVTLVSSLIWDTLISIDQVKSGRLRDCLLAPAMNLRGKIGSPISESSFGNVWIPYSIRKSGSESKFLDLVALIEDTTRNIISWVTTASGEEICTRARAYYNEAYEEMKLNKFCMITSWCRFPIYEADFGWGKPNWASAAARLFDMITLMDDKHGDGIEAWVSLNEKDMHLFEQHQNIIAFTS